MRVIPYGTQWIDEEDIKAVVEVLRSDWLTQGPFVERFEKALADRCGAKYAVVCSSGTAALHLACLAANIGPGDIVVTSPITFVASANCALYAGAEPRFVDIDPVTYNLSPKKLAKYLANNKVKALIPVHFAGLPCDMTGIAALAAEHDLIVIEDACHALGAEYRGADGTWAKVGDGRDSDMVAFSFHPVKPITTGEGGAVTTNDPEIYARLCNLRSLGITKNTDLGRPAVGRPWYYEMRALGYNYRLTDLQCALGLSQLTKLDGWTDRRREIAARYDEAFAGTAAIKTPPAPTDAKSAYHLYVIKVKNRGEVFRRLRESGIGVQVHYIPVHLQPYYRKRFGYQPGVFPAAESYYDDCVSIPIYPKMTDGDVETVIAAVKAVVGS